MANLSFLRCVAYYTGATAGKQHQKTPISASKEFGNGKSERLTKNLPIVFILVFHPKKPLQNSVPTAVLIALC